MHFLEVHTAHMRSVKVHQLVNVHQHSCVRVLCARSLNTRARDRDQPYTENSIDASIYTQNKSSCIHIHLYMYIFVYGKCSSCIFGCCVSINNTKKTLRQTAPHTNLLTRRARRRRAKQTPRTCQRSARRTYAWNVCVFGMCVKYVCSVFHIYAVRWPSRSRVDWCQFDVTLQLI